MVTEKDFIDKMIEILECGEEYTDVVKAVFFTWKELFKIEKGDPKAYAIAAHVYDQATPEDEYSIDLREGFIIDLFSVFDL